MGDYLSNLAARASGDERAAIRPRLRSRFEPAPQAISVIPAVEPAEEAVEQVADLAAPPKLPSPERPSTQARPRGAVQVRPNKPLRSQAEPATPSRPIAEETPPPPPAVRLPGTARRAEPRPELLPSPPAAPAPASTPASRPVLGVLPADAQPRPAIRPALRPLQPPPPAAARAEPARPATAHPDNVSTFQRFNVSTFERSNVPTSQRSNVPTFKRANVQTFQRVDAPTLPADDAPESERTEPTVRVTIGRIEVRVAAPPPAAERPKPQPPRLGLDEYLRRQAGGGGR